MVEKNDLKLLFVESGEPPLCFLKEILQDSVGRFVVKSGGLEALKLLTIERFDAVICEFHIPQFNGPKLLHCFRSFDKQTPFILCAAEEDEVPQGSLEKTMAHDYFNKSSSRAYVTESVRMHLILGYFLRQSEEKSHSRYREKILQVKALLKDHKEKRSALVSS